MSKNKYYGYDEPIPSLSSVLKLSTPRLLNVYKKIRKTYNKYFDEDGLYDPSDSEFIMKIKLYKEDLKKELNTREHVEK